VSAAPALDFPRRYATMIPLSDRRITCQCGHCFSPDLVLRSGRASLRCHRCHHLLLVAIVRDVAQKLIVEVTPEEVEALQHVAVRPGFDLLWLVLQPLGEARFRA